MNASRLRTVRTEKGLSQAKLAEMTIFISQNRISQLERGMFPKLDETIILAGVLGVQKHEIFPDLPPKN
jgi:transcriptional regulator with XRE-family HTH domain